MRRLLTGLAAVAIGAVSIGASKPIVGEMAPPFRITLVDGTKIESTDLRGQVVVLNFWATWCVPCRTELPLLDRYYSIQKARGLRVFAVTTEDSLPLQRMKKLFEVMEIPAARKISGPYASVRAVPTNYVIDRSGRLRYGKAAALDLDDLNRELVPLLLEKPPSS